ncbi:MAG: hypothetical protein ACK5LE_09430 [Alphaproteobacteria bacterium]
MPYFSYRFTATACMILFSLLAICFIIYPPLFVYIFGLDSSSSVYVVLRRSGVVFMGLAVIMGLTRGFSVDATQKAIIKSFVLAFFALAALGITEWFKGTVGSGVWLAIIVEILFGLMLIRTR